MLLDPLQLRAALRVKNYQAQEDIQMATRCTKRFLIIRETQIKITRYFLMSATMTIIRRTKRVLGGRGHVRILHQLVGM